MPRSLKKGPFVAEHLLEKLQALNTKGEKKNNYNMVSFINNCSNHDWPYNCGL